MRRRGIIKIPVALAATGPATFVQTPMGANRHRGFVKLRGEGVGGGGLSPPLLIRPSWRSKPYASPQYVPQRGHSPSGEPVQTLAGWIVQHRLPLPLSGQ